MSRVGTAFHRPFEEDMGLLIGTSFIIRYLGWQARECNLRVIVTNPLESSFQIC
jgi:hypothetical protein